MIKEENERITITLSKTDIYNLKKLADILRTTHTRLASKLIKHYININLDIIK